MVVTAGSNYYVRLADLDFAQAQRQVDEHLWLPMRIARAVTGRMPDGGSRRPPTGEAAAGAPAVGAVTRGGGVRVLR